MNAIHFRQLLFVCLAVLLAITSGSTALAGPPVFVAVPLDDTFVSDTLCPFPVEVHFSGAIKMSEHELRNGAVVRIERYFHATVTFTNQESGRSFTSLNAGPNHIIIEPDGSGTWASSGHIASITFPKEGLVLKDAGRLVWDMSTFEVIFEAGTHPIFVGSATQEFCAALGQ
jgi:hypothetical protein